MTSATIRRYLSRVTGTEDMSETRRVYHVGPRFLVEVTACHHDLTSRHDLMNVWKAAGYIPAALSTHLAVDTYYYDDGGNCWGRYNITTKAGPGGEFVIDFDYLREATPENERELVAECIRLAVKAGAIA